MKQSLILFILFFNLSFVSHAKENINYCVDNYENCKYNFSCNKRIYDILIIPYLSSVLNNREPIFVKLNKSFNNKSVEPFDNYSWKISQIDLIRCI